MKKLVVIAMLGLAACGGTKTIYVNSTDAPTTTKVRTTTEPPVVSWSPEDEFISGVESLVGATGVDDQLMIDTGYQVCEALRAGATMEMLSILITDNSSDVETQNFLAAVTASAVMNFCPEQQYKFN